MLRTLLDWIRSRRRRRGLEAKNPTATKVRSLVPRCLVCNADPAGHRFVQLASIPVNEETKPRVAALFHHIKNHEWEPLRDFKEFIGDQDDVIVYAVTGPHPGGMILLIGDPSELYARVEIYLEETVTAEELDRVKALVPVDVWQEL